MRIVLGLGVLVHAGSFGSAGEYAGVRGLARVTRMKLGFEETVEAKLTVE